MIYLRNFTRGTLAFLFLVISSSLAMGQNSIVSGTATDPAGNALAGVTITLTNLGNGSVRNVSANGDGSFQIPQVPPGKYRLRAEAKGFKALVQEDVEVLVNTPRTLNLAFREIGAVSEAVTITGGESTLNTSDATIGNSFNQYQVRDLPLNARNVVGLLSSQPGVTPDGSVNGGRSDQANVTLDGVDVNEQQNGDAFFSVLRLTPDSLQEFRVVTTNANADQGRSSGAQISLITKSGTNGFHGSLYEYHRNTVTSANNWFNNKAGRYTASDPLVLAGTAKAGQEKVPREALLRNNFGGAIGGPIVKEKLFFFFNYEGFRESRGTTVVREVPLATLGQGIVRYRSADGASDATCPSGTPAGVICLTPTKINGFYSAANGVTPGINNAALAALADAARRYPANDTTTGDGLNTSGYRFNASTPSTFDTYIAKIDFNLTSKQALFARLNYQNDLSTRTRWLPDTFAPATWVHPKGIAFGHTWTATNTLVNNFRYGLTRDSFTSGGDSAANLVNFRFIFQPAAFSRSLARSTPVHNFIDDVSINRGSHALQFGTNIRLITNSRTSSAAAYDSAVTNPSFYDFSGDVVLFDEDTVSRPIFPNVASGSRIDLRDALTAVIGRYSQYSSNLNYDRSGKLIPSGQGIPRVFKTQEYEFYGQDSWRVRSNLTLTYGVRYSTSTPVYEANGVQVKPTQSLGAFFDSRVAGANQGKPNNGLITVDIAGKVNERKGYYDQDWNNFAPAVAVAWSPNPKNRFLKAVFGDGNKSTIRGGFRMTHDRIGSALAVAFDLNSSLGYTSASTISANTFNVGSALGPLFTGYNPNVRGLPGLTLPSSIKFPLTEPADEAERIQSSLDDTLTTPVNYSFNVSYGRDLGKGFSFELSYVGRLARDLLVTRDIMHFNDLRDPQSGVTWYQGIRKLIDLRYQNAGITSIAKIPYFENLFPGLAGNYSVLGQTVALTATQAAYRRVAKSAVGGRNTTDYTFVQTLWDDGLGFGNNLFVHPQYAALSAFSTIGSSDYNSAQISVRKRLSKGVSFGFNYTFSHSIDGASGLQTSGSYGSAFILNPLDLDQNRGSSDFDIRHLMNANYIIELPFGDGKQFLRNMNPVGNFLLGGWTLTGIVRYNTGLAAPSPFDDGKWSTNWNVQSNGFAVRPIEASATRTGDPNLFSNPTAAYQSYRNSYPGEYGERNQLRYPSFFGWDMGVYKGFALPWEGTRVVFRWETFNVFNRQAFTTLANRRLATDPFLGGVPPADWGRFTNIQGSPRVMQFALRIEF